MARVQRAQRRSGLLRRKQTRSASATKEWPPAVEGLAQRRSGLLRRKQTCSTKEWPPAAEADSLSACNERVASRGNRTRSTKECRLLLRNDSLNEGVASCVGSRLAQ